MTVALWIIALCEVVRIIQNSAVLKHNRQALKLRSQKLQECINKLDQIN